MKSILAVLLITSLLSSFSVYANDCPVTERKVKIYYGNGMSNDEADAQFSLSALKNQIASASILEGYKISYDIAYNSNTSWYTQLSQIFAQKLYDEWIAFWQWVGGLADPESWFQQAMDDVAISLELYNYVKNEESKMKTCSSMSPAISKR